MPFSNPIADQSTQHLALPSLPHFSSLEPEPVSQMGHVHAQHFPVQITSPLGVAPVLNVSPSNNAGNTTIA